MLQTLHDRFSGVIAKIVLGVIVIIFGGFFGIQSYMNPVSDTYVALVNGHEISQDQFREHYNQYRSQMQRMYGKQFNALEFDTPQRKREMLDQMINEQLILEANEKLGATVPPTRIQEVIMSTPDFQVDGKFDRERYRLLLGASQKSAEWYRTGAPRSRRPRVAGRDPADQRHSGRAGRCLPAPARPDPGFPPRKARQASGRGESRGR